jgi:O-antigen ligase
VFGLAHQSWREVLGQVPSGWLYHTVSLSPYDTLGWGVLFLLSLLVALYVLGYPLEHRELTIASWIAVSGVLLYSVLALASWRTGWNYPFFEADPAYPKVFGFFPNRNHSAGFLATGAILSLGLVHSGGRQNFLLRIAALVAFLGLAYCLLFVSVSRGGVISLGLGLVLWILGLGSRHRPWWLLASLILVVGLGVVRFAGSDSALLERFRSAIAGTAPKIAAAEKAEAEPTQTSDARIALAKDTIRIIRDHPITGTGAGTYATVYPFYASASLMDKTSALHPESDWLMLAAESGLPVLLIAATALIVLLRRIPALKSLPDEGWPLRWAFISAFLAEIIHGFVDVPLHRLELGWWVMILGGIGFALPFVEHPSLARRIQRLLLLSGGILLTIMGGWMVSSQWFGVRDLPPFESINGRDRVLMRYAYADTSMEQLGPIFRECDRLIARYPMNGDVPNQYAIFLVQEHRDLPLAERLFDRARKLSVFNADLAFFHGKFLIDIDPKETLRVWKQALEFQMRLDAAPKTTVRRTVALFSTMMNESASHPEVMNGLWEIASISPQLQVAWLQQSSTPVAALERAVNDSSFMRKLSPREQSNLIDRWWERGGKQALEKFLGSHPEYNDAAAITRGRILVGAVKPKEACDLLIGRYSIPMTLTVIKPQSQSTTRADDDLEQVSVYLKQGNQALAARFLAEAKIHGAPPVESSRLEAILYTRSGNWVQGFATLLNYLSLHGDR